MKVEALFESKGGAAFFASLACFMWGSAFAAVKNGYRLFRIESGEVFSILTFAGLRFLLGGILVLALAPLFGHRHLAVRRSLHPEVFAYALFATSAMYYFYYNGLCKGTGLRSSMINACAAFVTVILAHFLCRDDKWNKRKGVSVLMAFVGLLLLHAEGLWGGAAPFRFEAEGFMVISSVMVALSSLWNKRLLCRYTPFALAHVQLFYGGAVLLLLGLWGGGSLRTERGEEAAALILMLWLALISGLSFSLWSLLLSYHSASRMDMFRCLIPIFATLSSYALLGEEFFTPAKLTALALIASALLVLHSRLGKREAQSC